MSRFLELSPPLKASLDRLTRVTCLPENIRCSLGIVNISLYDLHPTESLSLLGPNIFTLPSQTPPI
jgi:hypothetical protein